MNKSSQNPYQLPDDLPRPLDDGQASHLIGVEIPSIKLQSTDKRILNISQICGQKAVIYFYPQTGVIGKDPAPNWDDIPGAPGCTVQSLGFRDNFHKFQNYGVEIVGISTQKSEEQMEFSIRNKIPFRLLSDTNLELANTLNLPVFEVGGQTFLKRLALFVEKGKVKKVFYPVFPPNENAENVLAWIEENSAEGLEN